MKIRDSVLPVLRPVGGEEEVNASNDEEPKLQEEKDVTAENTLRRSERAIRAPRRLIEEMDKSMIPMKQ